MASGKLILPFAEPLLNSLGEPQVGATMTVYDNGTTNLASIYAEPSLSTPLTNPLTSDQSGRFFEQSNEIWADSLVAYTVKVEFPSGAGPGSGDQIFDDIWLLGQGSSVSGYAPIDSPAFTGTPTAPTPATNDNSTKLATTAYVKANTATLAPLTSPTFVGNVTVGNNLFAVGGIAPYYDGSADFYIYQSGSSPNILRIVKFTAGRQVTWNQATDDVGIGAGLYSVQVNGTTGVITVNGDMHITGNLTVDGNITATGTVHGSNIP